TVDLSLGSVNIDSADPRRPGGLLGEGPRPPGPPGRDPRDHDGRRPRLGERPPDCHRPGRRAREGRWRGLSPPVHRPPRRGDQAVDRPGRQAGQEAYLTSADHPTIRLTVLADPEGNPFNLATWQSE